MRRDERQPTSVTFHESGTLGSGHAARASGKRCRCHRVSSEMPHKNPSATCNMRRTELRDEPRASDSLLMLVGAERFELPTPCSQNRCATRLRYAPTRSPQYRKEFPLGNSLVPELAVCLACKGSASPPQAKGPAMADAARSTGEIRLHAGNQDCLRVPPRPCTSTRFRSIIPLSIRRARPGSVR